MDASAYLKKQGWRGEGHSLDHSNRGIKKPLLVSKKVDSLGVGLNKHKTVSDQWWLRAFDQGLKSLGTGEQSALASVQKHGVNRGGLYGRFVKGERIAGSIGQTPQSSEGSGASTPADQEQETPANMKIDVPPRDKLERVVGEHTDKKSYDAMMYLLQHPEAVPAGMKKMLDRRRKRAERPVEKRARRKLERQQRTKQEVVGSYKEGMKAEAQLTEQDKIDTYRAMKHGMSLEEYRTAYEKGEVQTPWVERRNLPPGKLAEYRKRAEEKGLGLEAYIRKREKKNAKKRMEKGEMGYVATESEESNVSATSVGNAADLSSGMGFVIDTEGDESLACLPGQGKSRIQKGKPTRNRGNKAG